MLRLALGGNRTDDLTPRKELVNYVDQRYPMIRGGKETIDLAGLLVVSDRRKELWESRGGH